VLVLVRVFVPGFVLVLVLVFVRGPFGLGRIRV